jgi:hypothetical protein
MAVIERGVGARLEWAVIREAHGEGGVESEVNQAATGGISAKVRELRYPDS